MSIVVAQLRRLLFALLTCAYAAGCQTTSPHERWLILERTSRPAPEIVSVVAKLPSSEVRARLPILLEVAWGYRGLDNGLPTEEEIATGRAIYAGLDKIVEGRGAHVMTRTGDGGRTMYYYVDDPAKLEHAIREFFDAQPPVSVKVTARPDPAWDYVREVLDAVRDDPQPSDAVDAPPRARR